MNSTNTSGAMAAAAAAPHADLSDEEHEAWARAIRIAHGDEAMEPASIARLMAMEETEAVVHGREGIFLGTSGPWMRISAPTELPNSTRLRQAMRLGGAIR